MVEPVAKDNKTGEYDIQKQYALYKNALKGAKQGEVVTRFPPEPSGYLHVGHVKAAMLNYHYAKMWGGKMILRFDDTNPNKEKGEYVQSITEDLAFLGITPDMVTHTSDHFDRLEEYMTKAITEGKCYCDDTPVEQMRKERGEGIESKNRNNKPEDNLKIWNDMRAGKAKEWCVRAKISMTAKNKCMRDPVFYRCSDNPHHRLGTKYKVYPTYDWACAIVDSVEGVTHTLRTNEYADRNEMYYWVCDCVGLRRPLINDFSRLNFVNTTLSKRKLTWFVDTKRVEGWDDPRFPTVRGIIRRGLIIETLTEFMLEQGPSKNTNLQEWDKLWATNKKYIDPKAGRYTAISKEKICTLKLTNRGPEPEITTVPVHPQNPALGTRPLFRTNELYLEYDDAKDFKVDEKITLMKWANCIIKTIKQEGEGLCFEAELAEHDTDFKSTKKVNWLPKSDLLANVTLVEYDHLINVKKVEDDMDFESILTPKTKFTTEAFGDPGLKSLTKKAIIQLERRGYYVVDRVNRSSDFDRDLELIYVPDGKTKTMSSISTKVDVGNLSKGTQKENPEETAKQKDKKAKKEKQAAAKEGGKTEGAKAEGGKTEGAKTEETQTEKKDGAEEPKQ
eukprot:CAMPEP_0176439066 /NCGR_PEP_ID=MMETSP0127-20121128/19702_1 /TAXON_ID=938130 /ORGANISM="Platyophrya macrostoma, Strain WH" /LENGTH=616 /DNA_ID=CAMNT_0017823225 /DNA_START=55 /DNA_END=1905 /DNA_ORIENTATION=+